MKKPCVLCAVVLFAVSSYSQETKPGSDKPEFKAEFPKEVVQESKHTVTIDGKSVSYTAIAGNLLLKEENGKPKANIFFVAYTKEGTTDLSKRPITFSFNGGPGSSSVWLHLGVLGPRRVELDDNGFPLPPPYRLIDNDYSILDVTDLCFIDPVTTGYSRAVPGEDDRQYHGAQEDVQSVGEFIRLFTTRYKRWPSPKFLIGESYGTTRAAGLSGFLQQNEGMYLNGIMLISSILNFETAEFDPGNDLPFILYVPSYTATAWYHKKLGADLQANLQTTLQASEAFARGEYASALMQGDSLSDADRKSVAEKFAKFTGVSQDFVERSNLRLTLGRFTKELMRNEHRTVGRLDSRFIGIDQDSAGENPDYDPSYAAIIGPFTATLNNYVRADLKYESDLPYEILTGRVYPWSFKNDENRYYDVAQTLRNAMTQNQNLKVFVASGFYDLATPYFATKYTFNHLGLDASMRNHVSMDFFEAGHMMYINKPSLMQLKKDLANFINASTSH